MNKQTFNEMVKTVHDGGDAFYNHRCYLCIKDANDYDITLFHCNTERGLVCEAKDTHYCTACKQANCYFHSSMVLNVNYCYNCINEMTRNQELKFE